MMNSSAQVVHYSEKVKNYHQSKIANTSSLILRQCFNNANTYLNLGTGVEGHNYRARVHHTGGHCTDTIGAYELR